MRTVPDFRYTNVQVWKGLRDWVKVNAGPLQGPCIRQRRTEMGKIVVLIPAYKPEEKMLKLLESLSGFSGGSAAGDRRGKEENTGINTEKAVSAETAEIDGIVIVDDGGQEEYRALFDAAEAMGCRVVHHEVNRGKGAAIRTGIREAMECFGADVHVVTADADGQHLPKDILRVARAVLDHNARGDAAGPVLVLGVRDFSGRDVPARSRLGNRITAAFFRLSTGTSCGDTQTGLRGIPAALLPLSLETEGDRYEYEMNFLTEAVRKADLVQIPIETVYEEGNRTSHFRPVRDSMLIYKKPLRYAASAAGSAAVDWALFLILLRLFGVSAFTSGTAGAAQGVAGAAGTAARAAGAAAAAARIGSGLFNFELNRRWSFQSKGQAGREAVRYLLLFGGNMLCNAGIVSAFSYAGMPAALGKAAADVTLFIVNYHVQKRWVFGSPRKR